MKNFDHKEMMDRYEIAKRKGMLKQIDSGETIALFNARKSLYVDIEEGFIGKIIMFLAKIQLRRKLKELKCKK
jgi:hypothetical protein